ncbi:DUF3854 domain-containing protein (plasmid) [Metabacillus halosaccharovorans]|uniref:DUF3854 domain-containing protein n=1 Tax=Metabacillus halosaccharovorans TaxID=930124 RepID=UPI00203A80B6|nr:DUF3854 domain-containing protein [Metabacillus halosaccharovorans]MCM3441356.1 DUF3854 domain-containing protein [Metabacillus halosaccharovorans]
MHKDGDAVACIRVSSDRYFSKNSSLPSYLHYLKGEKKRKKITTQDIPAYSGEEKLNDEALDMAFRALLNCLELSGEHYKHLSSPARGLTDEQIRLREYRSFPKQPWKVAKEMQNILRTSDLSGIPGFYLAEGKYGQFWSISGSEGILIPFRNVKNQIVGFQYRIENPPNEVKIQERKQGIQANVIKQPNLVQVSYEGEVLWERELELEKNETVMYDCEIVGWVKLRRGNRFFWLSSAKKNKGTGAGAGYHSPLPVHVSIPSSKLKNWDVGHTLCASRVWLGEGGLKGDISVDLIEKLYYTEELENIGTTFLSLPGVNAWRLALPILKEMNVDQVNICFDADAVNNVYVRQHLFDCAKQLKLDGYKVHIVLWNSSLKGIDDLLISGAIPSIREIK